MTSYRSIKRLKVLIPTLRERKRYVCIRIFCEKDFEYKDFEYCLYETMKKIFGNFTLAYLSFRIKKETFDKNKKVVILKCNHISLPFLIASLGFLKEIKNQKIIIKILKVSGTIKKIKEFISKTYK